MKQYNYIAVDFDGTLCEHEFPDIGAPKQKVIDWINTQAGMGAKIILHTCREGKYLAEAYSWCLGHGLTIHAINENPWVSFGGRKMYADIYLDDRAMNVKEIEGE